MTKRLEKNLEDFLLNEYSQSALYISFRSMANYVDGLKPGGRKILYTVKKEKINSDFKVNRLSSKVAELTAWIHGEVSLESAIVNMAQDYVGSNNLPLIKSSGTFGSRFIPSAAASRYICTSAKDYLNELFSPEDDEILIEQVFEGQVIEPKYYVPILPMILVNGSEGIGTGYAQKILPRNPKEIIEAVKKILNGEKAKCPKPHYVGFKGKIVLGENENSWEIHGTVEKVSRNKLKVTEIPVGISLNQYLEKLDRMVEDKTIKDYKDNSEEDNFDFDIVCDNETYAKSEDEIKKILGLIKKVSENYTCIDEDNKVRVFANATELLNEYVKVRKATYIKRKENLIKKYTLESKLALSKAIFIKKIISGDLVINNVPQDKVIAALEKIEDIIKVDGKYNYLLDMPVKSCTKERFNELQERAKEAKEKVSEIKKKNETNLWSDDLSKLNYPK